MEPIPFFRPAIGQEEIDEVVATLRSGWLTTGARTKEFEKNFAAYVGQTHAVALNSCTAALHLALEAIGLQAGEAVVVPTMTFAATAEVVRYFGARPILVDGREEDFNLDTGDAERRIQEAKDRGLKVRAIMPVHFGGQIGDVVGIRELARRHSLRIIEDSAHCCPGRFRESASHPWQSVGASAEISCFSFYANKTITTGEGGMACTGNAEYADRMRIMSLHGISRDAWKRFSAEGNWYYEIIAPGYKYNLTDVAAALGLVQLRKADAMHARRKEIAARYTERLGKLEELRLPRELPDRDHSWHLYPLRLRREVLRGTREDFINDLKQEGIGTSVHYTPLHLHPYYRQTFGYRPEDLPIMSRVYPEIASLPMFPALTDGDVDRIAGVVEAWVTRHRRGNV